MQIAWVLCFREEKKNENNIDAREDGHKPVVPPPSCGLDEVAANDWSHGTSKREPHSLYTSLGTSLVEEEKVIDGGETQGFAGSGYNGSERFFEMRREVVVSSAYLPMWQKFVHTKATRSFWPQLPKCCRQRK